MRKLFAFLMPVACLCTPLIMAPAQAGDAAAKLQALSQELKLQQKTEILPILKVEVPKIEAIKNNSSLSPGSRS